MCLVTVLLVGVGMAGVVTAATPANGSIALETDTDSVEDTVDGPTGALENTTNDTTADLKEAVDETSSDLEKTTDGTTDGLEATTDRTTDTLENTTNTLDGTVTETTDTLETTTNTTVAGLESDRGASTTIDAPVVGLEASVDRSMSDTPERADAAEAAADSGADGMPAGGTAPATDAVLVGLLGAITAASAGASAGTGAAAGAGTSAGAAGAGGLSGLVANWLTHSSGLRLLRRVGSVVPWELAPIFKYSRYDDSDPLENEHRRTVYETIASQPGVYLSQISDDSDVALSTVRHHVRILEAEGLVATAKVHGKRRYYLEADGERTVTTPDGTVGVELHAALAEPAKRELLETLAALGPVSNGRLADELECDPSTVSHHLTALAADDLIVREQDGRSVSNDLTTDVETVVRDPEHALEDDSGGTSEVLADD
ncbi:winged helix-turn-helix transcriptional regulator [Natronorubrum bangense]|uniref:MarR family transcriptional regulator n=1 Tax=Natronorubrum bangense JCM 10635 TaxID=1227500 RepID=L9WTC9_9EURY|nr:helix-turn-helix domain-containing protein [Natronorubrum bangense]ELY52729.1 MarR family transcriptional regulator [Natronorubrum bangense JCM 10635]